MFSTSTRTTLPLIGEVGERRMVVGHVEILGRVEFVQRAIRQPNLERSEWTLRQDLT
jgi:hypothetical protein